MKEDYKIAMKSCRSPKELRILKENEGIIERSNTRRMTR